MKTAKQINDFSFWLIIFLTFQGLLSLNSLILRIFLPDDPFLMFVFEKLEKLICDDCDLFLLFCDDKLKVGISIFPKVFSKFLLFINDKYLLQE